MTTAGGISESVSEINENEATARAKLVYESAGEISESQNEVRTGREPESENESGKSIRTKLTRTGRERKLNCEREQKRGRN